MPKTRVLVVEDSLTVRQRLVEILVSDPEIELVGEAEDGKRAIELCRECRPDVITMDMMLPVMSGLAATEYIMAHCPTPILVLSASMNRGEGSRSMSRWPPAGSTCWTSRPEPNPMATGSAASS